MSFLFKYMNAQYAEALLRDGSIKIGTLHEYFAVDLLGEEIGDRHESMAFCELPVEEFDHILADDNPNYLAQWVRDMVTKSPEARAFKVFFSNYMSIDQYTFCTTLNASAAVMEQFGYDTCVRISDPARFFSNVSWGLNTRAEWRGAFHCQYRDRGFRYEEAAMVTPELLKHPKYAYQQEVRALWYPKNLTDLSLFNPIEAPMPKLQPVIVQSPALAECCEEIKL